jgi:hypothetical protein
LESALLGPTDPKLIFKMQAQALDSYINLFIIFYLTFRFSLDPNIHTKPGPNSVILDAAIDEQQALLDCGAEADVAVGADGGAGASGAGQGTNVDDDAAFAIVDAVFTGSAGGG